MVNNFSIFVFFMDLIYITIIVSSIFLIKYRESYDKRFGRNSFKLVILLEMINFIVLTNYLTLYYGLRSL